MPEDVTPQAGTTQAQAATTETAATQAATANTQQTATAEQAKTTPAITLDAAVKELEEARKEAAKYRKQVRAAEEEKESAAANALKEQGKFKELYEKTQAEVDRLQGEVTRRDRAELQRTVAKRVGLPDSFAKRISGETEAEMEADARDMAAGLPAQHKPAVNNDASSGAGGAGAPVSYGGLTLDQVAKKYGVRLPKE
jgi:alanyl-tRNA synthetase